MEMFVIMGDHGKYSDHSEWLVAIYPSRELADEHVARLAAAIEHWANLPEQDRYRWHNRYDLENPLDPNLLPWWLDDNPPSYRVLEVPVREVVPAPPEFLC